MTSWNFQVISEWDGFWNSRIVKSNRISFSKAFKDHKKFIDFVVNDLGRVLEENRLMEIRGVLAHSDSNSISVKEALQIRNLILGVGCKGIIHELYQSFDESLKEIYRIKNASEKGGDKGQRSKNHLKVA